MMGSKKIRKAAEKASVDYSGGRYECLDFQDGFNAGINWFQNEVWHDATKDKEPQGVSGNRGVLVIGIRKGRVDYQYLWTDWEDCYKDLDILVDQVPRIYSHVLWAYIRDLVPTNLMQQQL